MSPFLTVFTPTYNRAYLLPKLYESLCRQKDRELVWLIVDDGSTDENAGLVETIHRYWKEGQERVLLFFRYGARWGSYSSVVPKLSGRSSKDALTAAAALSQGYQFSEKTVKCESACIQGKMMAGLISVIIPVYNASQWLERCLSSVTAQTYSKLDIILVDDGSTDGSGALCDRWAEKDRRVRVIHKANGGAAAARNAGLDVAKGEYIGFVDSDDYIAPDMFACLYEHRVPYGISVCGFEMVGMPEGSRSCMNREAYLEGDDQIAKFLDEEVHDEYSGFGCIFWNKLFHSSLFNHVRIETRNVSEDASTILLLLHESKGTRLLRECPYFYDQHESSISHSSGVRVDRIDSRMIQEAQIRKFLPKCLPYVEILMLRTYAGEVSRLARAKGNAADYPWLKQGGMKAIWERRHTAWRFCKLTVLKFYMGTYAPRLYRAAWQMKRFLLK